MTKTASFKTYPKRNLRKYDHQQSIRFKIEKNLFYDWNIFRFSLTSHYNLHLFGLSENPYQNNNAVTTLRNWEIIVRHKIKNKS